MAGGAGVTLSPVIICCSTSSPTTLSPAMFSVAFQGFQGADLHTIHITADSFLGPGCGTLSVGNTAITVGSGFAADATVAGSIFSPAVIYYPATTGTNPPVFAGRGDGFIWTATDVNGHGPALGGMSEAALLPTSFSYAIPLPSTVLNGVTYADGTVTGTYTSTYPPVSTVLAGQDYGNSVTGIVTGTVILPTPNQVVSGVNFGANGNVVGKSPCLNQPRCSPMRYYPGQSTPGAFLPAITRCIQCLS